MIFLFRSLLPLNRWKIIISRWKQRDLSGSSVSSDVNCRLNKSPRLHCTGWESLLPAQSLLNLGKLHFKTVKISLIFITLFFVIQIMLSTLPSFEFFFLPVSGISCVSWGNSRKLPAKSSVLKRSTRRNLWKSRISVFGSDMTLVPEPTTCIVNTVIWPFLPLSLNVIEIWELVIVPELTAFTSSELNLWPQARPDVLLSNRCTILRLSSLCLLACKKVQDHFSRPRDQIHTSFKCCIGSRKNDNKIYKENSKCVSFDRIRTSWSEKISVLCTKELNLYNSTWFWYFFKKDSSWTWHFVTKGTGDEKTLFSNKNFRFWNQFFPRQIAWLELVF